MHTTQLTVNTCFPSGSLELQWARCPHKQPPGKALGPSLSGFPRAEAVRFLWHGAALCVPLREGGRERESVETRAFCFPLGRTETVLFSSTLQVSQLKCGFLAAAFQDHLEEPKSPSTLSPGLYAMSGSGAPYVSSAHQQELRQGPCLSFNVTTWAGHAARVS